MLGGFGGHFHLLASPHGARFWVALHFFWRKGIKGFIVNRVHGNELTLQMG